MTPHIIYSGEEARVAYRSWLVRRPEMEYDRVNEAHHSRLPHPDWTGPWTEPWRLHQMRLALEWRPARLPLRRAANL